MKQYAGRIRKAPGIPDEGNPADGTAARPRKEEDT